VPWQSGDWWRHPKAIENMLKYAGAKVLVIDGRFPPFVDQINIHIERENLYHDKLEGSIRYIIAIFKSQNSPVVH
jgi:hypothetical protein